MSKSTKAATTAAATKAARKPAAAEATPQTNGAAVVAEAINKAGGNTTAAAVEAGVAAMVANVKPAVEAGAPAAPVVKPAPKCEAAVATVAKPQAKMMRVIADMDETGPQGGQRPKRWDNYAVGMTLLDCKAAEGCHPLDVLFWVEHGLVTLRDATPAEMETALAAYTKAREAVKAAKAKALEAVA